MMYFLQDVNESDALEVEIVELKSELNQVNRSDNKYQVVNSTYFTNYNDTIFSRDWIKNCAIPVGSLEFVQAYLSEFHGIDNMNPIEIPQCLRLPHILLRNYDIVQYENLPQTGNYFIKDVSKLKSFAYSGSMNNLLTGNEDRHSQLYQSLAREHLFQVSDILPILSEYRVIVIKDKIYGIQFYDGSPTIMPTPKEIIKIQEMVTRYSLDKTRPGAYAMDVAIVKTDSEEGRDLALVELCPTVSCGLYGCRGAFLPMMYRLGLEWYIQHNNKIEVNIP
jgi:hypothetical protein